MPQLTLTTLLMTLYYFLLIFFTPISLAAQLSPILHFYNSNWQLVNPAAVDKKFIFNKHRTNNLHGNYRKQWIGLEGSPTFYLLSLEHLPAQREVTKQRVKWGASIVRDQTGGLSNNGIYGNFSYYFPINFNHILHIGTTVGFIWHQLDQGILQFRNSPPPISDVQFHYVDINIGFFYRYKRKFYLGVSAPQTLALNNTTANNSYLEQQKNYNLIIGGFIQTDPYRTLINNDWIIEPTCWVRYIPDLQFQTLFNTTSISADAKLLFHYRQRFSFGAGFGTNRLVRFEFRLHKILNTKIIHNGPISQLDIGMSWQLPLESTLIHLGNSLEMQLHYAW